MERVSHGDARLGPYVGMYGADERTDDLCVVESRLAVEALLDSPYEPVSLLLAERHAEPLAELIARFPGEVLIATQDVIDSTVGFALHRGVVACARRGAPLSIDAVVAHAESLLVVECVNDPENLGALFRNAAAFGIHGVILDDTTCDPLSRRTIRVSMGHALRVPFARGALRALDGFTTIALTPHASVDVAALRVDRFALLVGNEGSGLTDDALALADVRAAIPMAKGVDSLNVATAAAVALALLGRGRD